MSKIDEFKPHSGPDVTLENVGIIYKNFMGEKGMYNEEGERSFNIVINDPNMAEDMLNDGLNLKPFLDEDDNVTGHHMKVKINYKGRPPRIYRVTDGGLRQVPLDVRTVGSLDSVTIEKADITLGTWVWRPSPLPNISVYCNVMYVHVIEDPLDTKYQSLLEGSHFDDDLI
jgi:hypothetical protein